MRIYISNRSTVISNQEVSEALPAFQHYAGLVASNWFLRTPTLVFTTIPPAASWQIVILDDADQAGALGYHDYAPGGKPIAKVFARTDKQNGYSWQITLTHELAEMQCDPWIIASLENGSRFWALEVGDPVEADALGFTYTSPSTAVVPLSDFVLPAWFIPGSTGPYDYKHHCNAPLQVLSGGYAQFFENGSWNQVGPSGRKMAMDPNDLSARTRFRG